MTPGSHSDQGRGSPPRASRGRIAVFAPSPVLTVTIESGVSRPEVHLHPGGQGFWVARMASNLDAEVSLCCALGGEPGRVLRGLLEAEPLILNAVDAGTPNGVYVHDRRGGVRLEVVNVHSAPLTRHASDALYSVALATGLDADVILLTGCQPTDVVDSTLYQRLAGDLRTNGKLVIADLTGAPLKAALAGGIDLLKLSEEELLAEQLAKSSSDDDLVAAAQRLQAAGAAQVVISRGARPAILIDDAASPIQVQLAAPTFHALDHRGAGDSMFAATGVGLARGMSSVQALRLGMAAGSLNVTRRGLGTGNRREIERLAKHVAVGAPTAIGTGAPCETPPRSPSTPSRATPDDTAG